MKSQKQKCDERDDLFIKNEGEIVDIIFGDCFVIGEDSEGDLYITRTNESEN